MPHGCGEAAAGLAGALHPGTDGVSVMEPPVSVDLERLVAAFVGIVVGSAILAAFAGLAPLAGIVRLGCFLHGRADPLRGRAAHRACEFPDA